MAGGLLGFLGRIPQDIAGAVQHVVQPQPAPQQPQRPNIIQQAEHFVAPALHFAAPMAAPVIGAVHAVTPALDNAVKAVQAAAPKIIPAVAKAGAQAAANVSPLASVVQGVQAIAPAVKPLVKPLLNTKAGKAVGNFEGQQLIGLAGVGTAGETLQTAKAGTANPKLPNSQVQAGHALSTADLVRTALADRVALAGGPIKEGATSLIGKLATSSANNATTMGAAGAIQSFNSTGQKLTAAQQAKQTLVDTGQAAVAGAALGAGGKLVGEAGKAATTKVAPALDAAVKGVQQANGAMGEAGHIKLPGDDRTQIQKDLSDAIAKGTNEPVYFGKLSPQKMAQVNELRKANGVAPLKTPDVHVFPAVAAKLQSKRVDVGGMSPDQVADVAYSALHNSKSKVLPSQYPHNELVVKPGESTSNLAVIGKTQKDVTSLKSAYQKNTKSLRATQGGGSGPPSISTPREELHRPTKVSGFQGRSETSDVKGKPSVSNNKASVNSTQTPEAKKFAVDNGFASPDTLGMNKESLKPEGVTQEQLDRQPTGRTNAGVHPGNSKAAIEGRIEELHAPAPITSTPRTPSLSAEHLDIPGKAPVDTAPPHISLKPPTTEKGVVKTFGSIKTTIARQGESGKELARRIVAVRETHARVGQSFKDAVPTVLRLNKGAQFKNFVDTVEGRDKPSSPKIARAVTEWQAVAKKVEERALDANIHMGHIEDYFPHVYGDKLFSNKKTYNQAIEHLVNTGQASDIQDAVTKLNAMREPHQGGHRFGNLEKARSANLPNFKMDKTVVANYLDRAARRIAEAEQFGRDNETVDKLVGKIAKEGKDANAAQQAFNSYFGRPANTATAKVAGGIRHATNVLTLSKAAISHSVQTGNTAIVTGNLRTAHAWASTALSSADRNWAKSIGINYDGHAGGHLSVVAPLLKQVRATNRIVSAIAGKRYGDALAKAGKVDELRKWGVQGDIAVDEKTGKYSLSADQQAHMGHAVADATQFSDDPSDLPTWARTPAGKMIGQYRMSYQYKQGGFLFNQIIKEAGRGNILPLLRAAAVVPVAGAAVVEAKHLLGSKTTVKSPEAVAEAGGLGSIPLALLDSTKYMYSGKSTAENLAGDVAPVAGDAVTTGFNISAAMAGSPKALEKQGLGYIPFIGTGVANKEFPAKTADPNAIAYVQSMDAARKSINSTKDQGVFDALYGSNKDSSGNKIPAVYDPSNSPFVAQALLDHPGVLAAATAFEQAFNKQSGQTIDPLYNLNSQQQQAALQVRAAAAFPGELKEDKTLLNSQLPANWQQLENNYYNSISASLKASGAPATQKGAPVYPTPSAQVAKDLADGNTKNNPGVNAYLDQIDAYNNQKRALLGLPQIAAYGTVPDSKQITNPSTYTSALKYAAKTGFKLSPSADGSSALSFLSGSGSGSSGGAKKLASSSFSFKSTTALSKLLKVPKFKSKATKVPKLSTKLGKTKVASTKMGKTTIAKIPKLKVIHESKKGVFS